MRRHAQRSDQSDEQSGLSDDGRAMCVRVAQTVPPYALVVASPLPRATETARLIGRRLDSVDPALLPELHGLPFGFWNGLEELADYVRLARSHHGARRLAEEQASLWAAFASRLSGAERALAVSHGAVIELGAIALAQRLKAALGGPVFGYCEGVVATFQSGVPTRIEFLRVT